VEGAEREARHAAGPLVGQEQAGEALSCRGKREERWAGLERGGEEMKRFFFFFFWILKTTHSNEFKPKSEFNQTKDAPA
jgi:hypothetical protein